MSKTQHNKHYSVRIPEINLNIDGIASRAEDFGLYPIDSNVRGIGYVADEKELLVVSKSNGYLKIKLKDLAALVEELQGIDSDMKFKKRNGFRRKGEVHE